METNDYSHLQLDVVALFLLTLAQLTKSNYEIIQTLEEFHFIQNLIFYIERAYRVPDFGIWERGSKTNRGEKEINSSSVGMCLAALEACSDLKLLDHCYLHVIADDIARCRLTLSSMLPRESNSKEVDSSILFCLSYPAFININNKVRLKTIKKVQNCLKGKYGFKRFLRDGYKTPLEDGNRLHYNDFELKIFDGIESQWPMFHFIWKINSYFYHEDTGMANLFEASVADNFTADGTTDSENIIDFDNFLNEPIPMLYSVKHVNMAQEIAEPNSTERTANYPPDSANKIHFFGESLFFILQLLENNLLNPSDLDPLNRHRDAKYSPEEIINSTIVQIVPFTENTDISENYHIPLKWEVEEKNDIEIHHGDYLSTYFFKKIGEDKNLDLLGRKENRTGALSTCRIYRKIDFEEDASPLTSCEKSPNTFVESDTVETSIFNQYKNHGFTSRIFQFKNFYFIHDPDIIFDMIIREINHIANSWSDCNFIGRPVFFFPIDRKLVKHRGFQKLLAKTCL